MKLVNFISVFILLTVLCSSCSKSGTKALQKGEYYSAVILAVDKLKKDPLNEKALAVLPDAYSFAKKDLLSAIAIVKASNQQFKWESVLESYDKLNKMHDLISNCTACRRETSPIAYTKDAEETRALAAEQRYILAIQNLQNGSLEGGRGAYRNLIELSKYAPNYKDVRKKIEEALQQGSVHVVIEPAVVNSRLYKLSSDYFNEQVNEFLVKNKRMNEFVRFYTPDEAETVDLTPDHVLKLEFLDFVVGQTFLESKKETLISADSVKTGTVNIRGKQIEVFDKVKADYTYNNKIITSKGILGLTIVDFGKDKVLHRREMAGEFVWQNQWSIYNGDERALNEQQLTLSKSKELLPPAPEVFFVEFCKPIHSQLTSELTRFYKDY